MMPSTAPLASARSLPGPEDSTAAAAGASLSVVIVTHDSAAALRRTLPAVVAELRDGDELIVVRQRLRRRHDRPWSPSSRRRRP